MTPEDNPWTKPPEAFDTARTASFCRFRELVLEDAGLQDELLKIANRERFLDAVVAAGVERGYEFGLGEVEAEFNRRRREWMERSVTR